MAGRGEYIRLNAAVNGGMGLCHALEAAFGSLADAFAADAEELIKVPGLGPKTAKRLLGFSNADVTAIEDDCDAMGIRIITYDDELYPESLKQIEDAPCCLYWRGSTDIPWDRAIAVVGARKCTVYGRHQATVLSQALVERGGVVVSGLAQGIDGFAHRGALDGKGPTVAVLGGGLQQLYPARHRGLANDILNNGGALLSEYPPHQKPIPAFFLSRNRIVSGLSRGVLVVEAGERSGSLSTAHWALQQDREVLAVPGSIGSGMSVGCHNLIKQGAALVASVDDIIECFGDWPTDIQSSTKTDAPEFDDPNMATLFEALTKDPQPVHRIIDSSGLSAPVVQVGLIKLCMAKHAMALPGQLYVKV